MNTKLVPKTPKELIVVLYTIGCLVTFFLVLDGQQFTFVLDLIVNLMIMWSFGMLFLPLI